MNIYIYRHIYTQSGSPKISNLVCTYNCHRIGAPLRPPLGPQGLALPPDPLPHLPRRGPLAVRHETALRAGAVATWRTIENGAYIVNGLFIYIYILYI